MTDAINYIQSLLSFASIFAPAKIAAHDTKLVKALIKDAKSLADVAAAEAEHGATAQNLMLTAQANDNQTLAQNMATIAVWHFERSLRKYQNAAARYSEAGRVQTKQSRLFFAEARDLTKHADETAARIKSLNDLLAQN